MISESKQKNFTSTDKNPCRCQEMCYCGVWSPEEPVNRSAVEGLQGEKRIQFVSLLIFQGDTFSFSLQSSSLNPTRYCVTRAMILLFSYKSTAARRNPPSSVFYCCWFFNHVVWLQALGSFQTTDNICKQVQCRNHLKESLFRTSFSFFRKGKKKPFPFIFWAYL